MNTLNSELLPLQHINDCKPFVVVNDGFVTQESSQTIKTQRIYKCNNNFANYFIRF